METAEERKGNWIMTFTGGRFWIEDPRPEEVSIQDIAHALSLLCRFTGHCKRFYSVAEHSMFVAARVPMKFRPWALLHDAAEAYVADISRPLKSLEVMSGYRAIEDATLRCILERFGLHHGGEYLWMPPLVREVDRRALWTEMRDLMPSVEEPLDNCEPFEDRIPDWVPTAIESEFLTLARSLGLT
jgi:uncharacterized protein